MYPIPKTATSHIAWDNQQIHMERYLMYNHDQIAAAERRPKEARIVCHQKNPNKCRAIAWWSVNNDAENIIAAISFPKIITDFVVTNHLNTYSSKRLFKKIQYNIPSIYKLILESPLAVSYTHWRCRRRG